MSTMEGRKQSQPILQGHIWKIIRSWECEDSCDVVFLPELQPGGSHAMKSSIFEEKRKKRERNRGGLLT